MLEAYAGFSPRLADLAEPFFDKGWIDAAVTPGKAPGAFAHPTVTTVHPYVLLNYLGNPRDVMTLAHELGHGVHQRLAAGQGELLASTPLTLAETASVFGEMLTFRALLAKTIDPAEKKALLAGNDSMALGAVSAVRAAGKRGQVQVIGYDNIKAIHPMLKDGRVLATVDQFAAKQAVFGIEAALKLIKGEPTGAKDGVIETPVELITQP